MAKYPRTICPMCKQPAAFDPSTGRIMSHYQAPDKHGDAFCWVGHNPDDLDVIAAEFDNSQPVDNPVSNRWFRRRRK